MGRIIDIKFRDLLEYMHEDRHTNRWGAYAIAKKYGYAKPIWHGKFELGKTILIVGEGGYGDELFTAKFSKNFVRNGMKVVFAANYWSSYNILARIKTIYNVVHITEITTNKHFEDYDYWVPAGEVPVALNLTQNQVPLDAYLEPTEEYLTKWKRIIPPSDKFKIGVRWTGHQLYEEAGGTIIPVQYFEELGSLPNVELYSLHKDDGMDDIPKDSKMNPLHEHGKTWLETWDDTLACISQLDLTISSSTCIPIVCAALNKPIWTVTPYEPYYLWLRDFWFGDKMRIYLQSIEGDWNQPFEDIKHDLLRIL